MRNAGRRTTLRDVAHPAVVDRTAGQDSRLCSVLTGDGQIVSTRCLIADTPLLRMRGLLGRTELAEGEGVLIRPTNAIHMWFMRFAIDAIFLDDQCEILRIAEGLGPWRMAACRGAKSVLEVAAGTCAEVGVTPGDRLRFDVCVPA